MRSQVRPLHPRWHSHGPKHLGRESSRYQSLGRRGVKIRGSKASEAQQPTIIESFDRPQPESVLVEACLVLVDQGVARMARQRSKAITHDLRIAPIWAKCSRSGPSIDGAAGALCVASDPSRHRSILHAVALGIPLSPWVPDLGHPFPEGHPVAGLTKSLPPPRPAPCVSPGRPVKGPARPRGGFVPSRPGPLPSPTTSGGERGATTL